MKKELDNYLVDKYPKIFINRYGDMKTTSMCWGFQHNDGWFWIVDQLCNSIQSYIDNNNLYNKKTIITQTVATSVKEKFGRLSFNIKNNDDTTIYGMIRLAEQMSEHMCEFCGSTKNVGDRKSVV